MTDFSIALALWTAGADGKVRGNDKTGALGGSGDGLRVNASTGNDANSYVDVAAGTHKWATIGRALWGQTARPTAGQFQSPPTALTDEAVAAGDVVIIEAGTYYGEAQADSWVGAFAPLVSGSSGNLITIKAEGTVNVEQTAVDTGTATAGAARTLTDTGQSWTTNEYTGYWAKIISGTGSGQARLITSNTATVLTLLASATDWSPQPSTDSVYEIRPSGAAVSTRGTGTGHNSSYTTWTGDTASDWFVISANWHNYEGKAALVLPSADTMQYSNFDITAMPYGAYGDNNACIRVQDGVNVTIKNNQLGNLWGSSGGNTSPIMTYSCRNSTIENNEIFNTIKGMYIKGIIDADDVQDGLTVRYNIIRNIGDASNTPTGIHLEDHDDRDLGTIERSYYHDNLMYDFDESAGGGIGFRFAAWPREVTVANNTVYGMAYPMRGPNGASLWENNEIKNNICVGSGGSGSQVMGFGDCASVDFQNNMTSNYNCYFDYGTNFGALGAAARTTFADWKTESTGDANSFDENPDLTDPATDDYTIQQGVSPCDGTGLVISAIHGGASTVNIGCYSLDTEVIGNSF